MGVYIKDMEMPKRCVGCACYVRKTGDGVYTHGSDGCNALGMRFNEDVYYGVNIHDPFDGIYKDCPLVEVAEPHGRLIDADRLLEERRVHTYYHLPNGCVAVPIIDIEHAPTIIEGSE